MSDRCHSTLICAAGDQAIFAGMGYKPETAQAMTFDGEEIPNVMTMVDPEADNGNHDALIKLEGLPFLVSNGGNPGAFGDHLLVSDGNEWCYTESLAESNYPAVRVGPDGRVSPGDLDTAAQYWRIYLAALQAFRERANPGKPPTRRVAEGSPELMPETRSRGRLRP